MWQYITTKHTLLDTIRWFLRWLAYLKWDLFIREPPSELVTQTERHSPQVAMQMDEDVLKMLEIDKSLLELGHGIHSTRIVHILPIQLPQKKARYF